MNQLVARAMLTAVLLTANSSAQTEECWINPRGGNWLIAQNWSGGRIPNNTPAERFNATFKLTPAQAYTTAVNGKVTIDNLRLESSRATITVPSGSVLSVTESGVLDAGTLRLLGGKLSGGEWVAAPGVLDIGNFATTEFAGVSWRGDIVLGAVGNQFRISGGLALNGRLALTSGGTTVTFDGDQSILGGNIFVSPATNSSTLLLAQGAKVTLSPSTYLNGGGGDFAGDGTLINKGRIKADRASKTLSIMPKKFINAGRMEGLVGATLVIGDSSGTWMQTEDGQITAAGTLTLRGEWSNQGTISTSGTVNLNGTFGTASLDGFAPAGGTVNVTGTWDNRGRDYYLAGASNWNFQSGKIYGGTLISSPALPLRITGLNPVLESISAQGPIVFSNACRLNIGEGALVPGPITFANDATVRYLVDSVMEGQTFAFNGTNNRFSVATNAELTIGQTLEGASFSIRSDTGGVVRNEGTIRAMSGRTVIVEPTRFDNAALCESTGGTLRIGYDTSQRAWTNLPDGTVRSVNGTLELGGTWSNHGSIEAVNSAVRLFGNFTAADLQSLSMQGGSLALGGTLDNSNNTLTLNQTTGNWTLTGSPVIRGGVLRFQDGAHFTIASSVQLRLESMDVADLFELGATSGTPTLTFATDATASGGVRVTRGNVRLEPSRIWNAEVRVESTNSSTVSVNQPGTVTLGSDSLISGGEATIAATQGGACVNEGTIRADIPNRGIAVQGLIDNSGLIEAVNGGSVSVGASGTVLARNLANGLITCDAASRLNFGGRFANYGTILVDGGRLDWSFSSPGGNFGLTEVTDTEILLNSPRNFGTIRAISSNITIQGDFSTSDLGDLRNEGGTVLIAGGTLNNQDQTLYQNSQTGSWVFGQSLTIRGGVIDQSEGVHFGIGNNGGLSSNAVVLDGVTIRGDVLISNNSNDANVRIPNGITMLDGTIRIGRGSQLRIPNAIDGVSIALSGPSGSSAATIRAETSATSQMTIGANTSISGNGRIDAGGNSIQIINRGAITATTGEIRITPRTFANEGTIGTLNGSLFIGDTFVDASWTNTTSGNIVVNGGSITTAGPWSNLGTFEVRDGWAYLRGTFTTADFDSITFENSYVNLGTVQNAGHVFDFDDRARFWRIEGSINGGGVTKTGTVGIQSLGGRLNGVTLESDIAMSLAAPGFSIGSDGLLLNGHTLTLDGNGQSVSFQPGVGPVGPGTIAFTASVSTNYIRGAEAGTTISINPDVVIRGGGVRIGDTDYYVVNHGTVSADVGGGTISMVPGSRTCTNAGLVEARNGGTMVMGTTIRLTNIIGNTLTGGRWAVYSGSTLLLESAEIHRLDAELVLSGAGSVLAEIANLNEIAGSFTIDEGRDFSTVGNMANHGVIHVGRGSQLSVAGSYAQSASGEFVVNLSGTGSSNHGQLAVSAGASLSGSIRVELTDAFAPQLGDSFTLVTAQSVVGQFSDVQLPELPPGMVFSLEYSATTVVLNVVTP